jgi:serine protease
MLGQGLSRGLRLGLVLLGVSAASQAAEFRTVAHPIQGQYVVVLNPQAARLSGERSGAPLLDQEAPRIAGASGARLTLQYRAVLRGFAVRADDRALARLLSDPRVAYVQEDGVFHATTTQTGATWGLDRIDQRNLPRDGNYNYTTTASGVHAYIVDTGIYAAHSQFTGRVAAGYTAIADGRGTNDCNGHGTHVSGTVGGGTYGVAKGVTLHPVRVLDCSGVGATSGVVAGLDWIATHRVNPAVANMSLAGPSDPTMNAAVTNLINSGVTVVVAAGNNGVDAANTSPANDTAAITVASMRTDDGRSYFSNYGSVVDVFAPGSNITSAWITSTTATTAMSGTSMAAPHVTGAVALYLAAHPTSTPAQVASGLLGSASPGRVLAAGAGSPNRLLYTRGGPTPAPLGAGPGPPNVRLACQTSAETYSCTMTYSSTSPATVIWPGTDLIGTTYDNSCISGQSVTVRAIVGNRYSSVSASNTFTCKGGLVP